MKKVLWFTFLVCLVSCDGSDDFLPSRHSPQTFSPDRPRPRCESETDAFKQTGSRATRKLVSQLADTAGKLPSMSAPRKKAYSQNELTSEEEAEILRELFREIPNDHNITTPKSDPDYILGMFERNSLSDHFRMKITKDELLIGRRCFNNERTEYVEVAIRLPIKLVQKENWESITTLKSCTQSVPKTFGHPKWDDDHCTISLAQGRTDYAYMGSTFRDATDWKSIGVSFMAFPDSYSRFVKVTP